MPFEDEFGTSRQPAGYEATIATTPDSVTDTLQVLIDNFDGTQRFDAAGWQPRIDEDSNVVFPARGDRALVAFADQGDPWVIAWTPTP